MENVEASNVEAVIQPEQRHWGIGALGHWGIGVLDAAQLCWKLQVTIWNRA